MNQFYTPRELANNNFTKKRILNNAKTVLANKWPPTPLESATADNLEERKYSLPEANKLVEQIVIDSVRARKANR